jgi:hypothetical protein
VTHRRALCLDGPLAGATVSFDAVDDVAVLASPDGRPVSYRIGELLSTFPGYLHAARLVSPED